LQLSQQQQQGQLLPWLEAGKELMAVVVEVVVVVVVGEG
jgi:hypothetical protein